MTKIVKTGEAIRRRGDGAEPQLTTFIPLCIKRCGGRKLILPPAGNHEAVQASPSRVHHDQPLLAALTKAFHWQRLLDEGLVASGSEIAEREGLHHSWVNEHLRLALLAPDIIAQMLEGGQPKALSLVWLQHHAMPVAWEAQREVIRGFDG